MGRCGAPQRRQGGVMHPGLRGTSAAGEGGVDRPARLPRRAVLVALALPALAHAQSAYPNRPIRMLCGFPPAGTTDIAARLVSERLSARLGQPVAVENRAGATGNIAAEMAARAEP